MQIKMHSGFQPLIFISIKRNIHSLLEVVGMDVLVLFLILQGKY